MVIKKVSGTVQVTVEDYVFFSPQTSTYCIVGLQCLQQMTEISDGLS